MLVLGSSLLDTLQPWVILGGNLVAVLVMLGILGSQPQLRDLGLA